MAGYYVVGEPDTIRVPKLNKDHAGGGATLDLDGGDAGGTTGAVMDLDGGTASG